MGHWGYLVVGRAARPLAALDALPGAGADLTLRTEAPDGWQVWELSGREGELGSLNELAKETGAPALFGYVMAGECVAVEVASPGSGVWTACLGRDAMAGDLDGRQEGLTVDDYFPEPAEAAERAVFWAEEAGREVAAEDVLEALTAGPGPMAENGFFRLLDRLRVVPG
ncbi:hypothetical protein ROS62_14330 [Streptomyces sp. DSM 41972]|uniref:Uncharacterized protein n=1 Tax=Streptomyces althioticus subsp. attaecolombicae TaxID=3075534 RepID=A0ABU3HZ73_9ACTN|nr:hypothetical protein [Streptomyces sp. DSM 41972]SCE05528.1 hypothetical protein GA0115245_119415 [Streptomyces sp. di188]